MIARTSFAFVVVLAAHLVAGYAYAPDAVAHTLRFLFVRALQAALWARELILGPVEHRAAQSGGAEATCRSRKVPAEAARNHARRGEWPASPSTT